MKNKDFFIKYM